MSARVERPLFGPAEEEFDRRLEAWRRLASDFFTLVFMGITPDTIQTLDCSIESIQHLTEARNRQLGGGNRTPWPAESWPRQFGAAALGALLELDYDRTLPRDASRYGRRILYPYSSQPPYTDIKPAIWDYIAEIFRRLTYNANQAGGLSTAHHLLAELAGFVSHDPACHRASIARSDSAPTPPGQISDPRLHRFATNLARLSARARPVAAPKLRLSLGPVICPVPAELSLGDVLDCLPWPLQPRFGAELALATEQIRAAASLAADGAPITGVEWDNAEKALLKTASLPQAYQAWWAFRRFFENIEEGYRKKVTALNLPAEFGLDLSFEEARRILKLSRTVLEVIKQDQSRRLEEAYRQAWTELGAEIVMPSSAILANWDSFRGSRVGRWKIDRPHKPGGQHRDPERGEAYYAGDSEDQGFEQRFTVAVGLDGRGGSDTGAAGRDATGPDIGSLMFLPELDRLVLTLLAEGFAGRALPVNRGMPLKWPDVNSFLPEIEAKVKPALASTRPYAAIARCLNDPEPAWALFKYYFKQWLTLQDPDSDIGYSQAERLALDVYHALPDRRDRAGFLARLRAHKPLIQALEKWRMGNARIYGEMAPCCPEAMIEVFEYFFRRDVLALEFRPAEP